MRVEVERLAFAYEEKPILRDVSFTAGEGQFLSILGPNGAGKSTLFRCVLGLQTGYTGTIRINGTDARRLSPREMAGRIAYIPQSSRPTFRYSVFDIVLMGASRSLSPFGAPGRAEYARCEWALEKIGISHLSQRCFHRLSGGEQQLVMIARALMQDAPVLLMDEPTANLDYGNQLLVMRQAKSLAREGYTVIQTTHAPEQSYLFSDRILAMSGGRIIRDGPPAEVLTAETVEALYGVNVRVVSLNHDTMRVCIPKEMMKEKTG